MKTISYFIEYAFFRFVALIVNLLPYVWAVGLGRQAGHFLYGLMKKRREIALNNLRAAFPEKAEGEIIRIARDSFANLGRLAIEFVCIPKLDKRGFIRNTNTDRVWKALARKKGLIFIVSHLTNWEVMAVATAKAGFPMHAVGRPLKNPFVYRYVMRLRGHAGLRSVDKKGAARETINLLNQNQVVCFLVDQHERQSAVRVQFFGRPCYASSVAARLAVTRGVPAISLFCYRDQDGILTTDYEEPSHLIQSGDEMKDAQKNTQLFMDKIEEKIRETPGNWLWMHRRWRPAPDEN